MFLNEGGMGFVIDAMVNIVIETLIIFGIL